MSAKITFKTSEEHTKKTIVEFFARTSHKRILESLKQQKEQQGSA